MKRLFLAMALASLCSAPAFSAVLCPDGSWAAEQCNLCPDGSYHDSCDLSPNGGFGGSQLCPDGSYHSSCGLCPDGHFGCFSASFDGPVIAPVAQDDSDQIADKGNWPVGGQGLSVDLPARKQMTHVYHLHGTKGQQLWLQVTSKDFPPEIVLNSHGKLSMPFGSFMPPDGLPTDEYGREVSLTLQRDGQWITAVELALEEDQDLVLLVGRAVQWQANGQGGSVQTTGALGGTYLISGTNEFGN